ncbi:hypothetical protein DDZ18_10010 [Marinicauda salina]|uniref:Uncharacterized protein n=1 Tax=Marinicauda salina TaxID=2135793 RepID=A0A2U2BSP1_9PROT|nr:hypothetical protein [Marinicauda salina]PWE17029.1 hypothetical protein DDZ18_10010 [Marinicauda salina]
MTTLTATKIDRLRALLGALPDDLGAQLADAAAASDPALARLVRYCSHDPEAAARERFFAPIAPLAGDPETTPPSRACAPPDLLEALWRWIADDLDPEAADAARAAAAAVFEPEGEGRLDEARARAAAAMLEALDEAKADETAERNLRRRLGVADLSPLRGVAVVLRGAPALRAALSDLPDSLDDISDEMRGEIRDRYERVGAADPDAAAWFLHFVMARLTRPWRILRVFELIAKREDDLLVSQTDMCGVGDALLADAGHHLEGFARPPETRADADAAVAALAGFAAITVGMTREIGIRKEGAWGQALVKLRGRAAEQMERIHRRALEALDPIAPDPRRRRSSRFRADAALGEAEMERARALVAFMRGARDDASRAAVGGAHQHVLDQINERLEAAGNQALAALRDAEPDAVEAAAARLEAVAALIGEAGETESAEILVRRGVAARAA